MAIYLDYNASSPIDERVLDTMIDIYKNYPGNPDSRTHDFGKNTRTILEEGRKKVGNLLNVQSNEVFFTSGATESNNIAVLGLKEYALRVKKNHIITTSVEHKAILETMKHLENNGFIIDYVNPNQNGEIEVNQIKNRITEKTLLVSVMHVNNETGVIFPVEEIGELLDPTDVLFHIDATQSAGKLVPELKKIKYDMLTLSSHKLAGPQGIGALILRRKNYELPPIKAIMFGGEQEGGIRPGTVPTALVAGFGKACELAEQDYESNIKRLTECQNAILELLKDSTIKYSIHGNIERLIPNTLNIAFEGINSEALMILTKGFCGISNGSACNSKNYKGSYVLESMGLNQPEIASSVRISWGPHTNLKVLKEEFARLLDVAKNLQ